MNTSALHLPPHFRLERKVWLQLGLVAAAIGILAVLCGQALAIALWPEVALFRPLDSYARSAVFVLVPAFGATVVFAWLAERSPRPASRFILLSIVLLLISFIPDYALPDAHKTLLASTVAALLHVVAAVCIVGVLVSGYTNLLTKLQK